MSEQIFNKLVRDKIPEIILADNRQPVTRILDDVEFKSELEKKLLEEYREVLATTDSDDRVEELADMIEVFSALVRWRGKRSTMFYRWRTKSAGSVADSRIRFS